MRLPASLRLPRHVGIQARDVFTCVDIMLQSRQNKNTRVQQTSISTYVVIQILSRVMARAPTLIPDDTKAEFIVGTQWLLPPDDNDAHTREITERMQKELDVGRADSIRSWMWIAGVGFKHIRALHHNALMRREVIVTESCDLHLIWNDTGIFVKPIPPCKLNPQIIQSAKTLSARYCLPLSLRLTDTLSQGFYIMIHIRDLWRGMKG